MEIWLVGLLLIALVLVTGAIHVIFGWKQLREAKFIVCASQGQDRPDFLLLVTGQKTEAMVRQRLRRSLPYFYGTLLLAALWVGILVYYNVNLMSQPALLTGLAPIAGTFACIGIALHSSLTFEEAPIRYSRSTT